MNRGTRLPDAKQNVVVTIENAKHNLETALQELQKLRILDPKRIAFSAQALNNFITVTEGTVDLLSEALKTHPNPEIKSWLEGLQHTTKLMGYAVSQLFSSSINGKPNFEFSKIFLPKLIERVCNYYQKLSELRNVDINFQSQMNMRGRIGLPLHLLWTTFFQMPLSIPMRVVRLM